MSYVCRFIDLKSASGESFEHPHPGLEEILPETDSQNPGASLDTSRYGVKSIWIKATWLKRDVQICHFVLDSNFNFAQARVVCPGSLTERFVACILVAFWKFYVIPMLKNRIWSMFTTLCFCFVPFVFVHDSRYDLSKVAKRHHTVRCPGRNRRGWILSKGRGFDRPIVAASGKITLDQKNVNIKSTGCRKMYMVWNSQLDIFHCLTYNSVHLQL